MTDRIHFDAPVGAIGRIIERALLRRYLRQLIEVSGEYLKPESRTMVLVAPTITFAEDHFPHHWTGRRHRRSEVGLTVSRSRASVVVLTAALVLASYADRTNADKGYATPGNRRAGDPLGEVGRGTSGAGRAGGLRPRESVAWRDTVSIQPGGAWPRLARLRDGSWLAVVTAFPSANTSVLTLHRSTDNGMSWVPVATVSDGGRKVDNGFLYQLPSGDVLLFARNLVDGKSYRISQWRSTNGGKSWSGPTTLDANETDPLAGGLWEPFAYGLADGRLAIMYADETHDGFSQVIGQRVSSDGGRTWGGERVVVTDGASGRPGMPGVTRMTNGQFFLVFEVCGTRQCDVYSKNSANGVDWMAGVGSRIPGHQCGPFVTSLSDGRMLVASCRSSATAFDSPVSVSFDFGSTWARTNPPWTDAGVYGGWPALYQFTSRRIGYVAGVRGGQTIRFGRVSPPWCGRPTAPSKGEGSPLSHPPAGVRRLMDGRHEEDR